MSVKAVAKYPQYIRGKRYRPIRVGYIARGMCTNTTTFSRFLDNTRARFFVNSVVLLKRRGTLKSKYIKTPFSRQIRRTHYKSLFHYMF